MKLRYLRVRNLPPLDDIALKFGHEPMLGRPIAIHFVVGVNGSGKSRLLQALAEIVLAVEALRWPDFPFSLVYDLGSDPARTIIFHKPGHENAEAALIVQPRMNDPAEGWTDWLARDWRATPQYPLGVTPSIVGPLNDTTLVGSILPSAVLAATSGNTVPWGEMLIRYGSQPAETASFPATAMPDDERPRNWTSLQESERLRSLPASSAFVPPVPPTTNRIVSSRVTFVSHERLNLALAAVALTQAAQEFAAAVRTEAEEQAFLAKIQDAQARGERMSGLRGILNEVDWLWPLTLSLDLRWDPDDIEPSRLRQLQNLARLATGIRREPGDGPGRTLTFDLRRPLADRDYERTLTDALLEALGGGITGSTFGVFTTLCTWQAEGLLRDITLTVRKRSVKDVLLFDWLSDGERLFLCRMALFYLLRDQTGGSRPDALILLDEPETHFNDVWKREIVDIIDESLGDAASDAVITTHSSICLTDVFDDEITLLRKQNGIVRQATQIIRTFGASPNDIMRHVFGAADTVGQRAAKYLDLILLLAAHPDLTRQAWEQIDRAAATAEQAPAANAQTSTAPPESLSPELLTALREQVEGLRNNYGTDAKQNERLNAVLQAVRTRLRGDPALTGPPEIADVLSILEDRLGNGYYQFEFRRRLRALTEGPPDAA